MAPTLVCAAFSCTVDNPDAPTSATCTGSASFENVRIDTDTVHLHHNFGAGFNSVSDWDSTLPGDQLLDPGFGHHVAIVGNGGGDRITLGNTATSPFNIMQTNFTVTESGGGAVLVVDDADPTAAHAYTFDAGQLDVDGSVVQYAGVAAVTLNASDYSAGDTVRVRATAAGVTTTINAGDGVDQIAVGDDAHTLDGIAGAVVVDGGAGSSGLLAAAASCPGSPHLLDVMLGDSLTVDDAGHADPAMYAITPSAVTRADGPQVAYGNIESLFVHAGAGADHIEASTAGAARCIIDAGGGNDVLDVSDTGAVSRLEADGGGDDDTIILENAGIGSSNALFGNGTSVAVEADTLIVRGTRENASVHLLGDNGDDTIRIEGSGPNTAIQFDRSTVATDVDTVYYAGASAVQGTICAVGGTAAAAPAVFQLASAALDAVENGRTAVATVTRSGSLTGAASVTIATSDATAQAGVNYGAVLMTLAFGPDETSKTVEIPLIDDFFVNATRTAGLRLTRGVVGPVDTTTLSIADDDTGRPALSVRDVALKRGRRRAVFKVSLEPKSTKPVLVDAVTADGTAVAGPDGDYLARDTTLLFKPKQRKKKFVVRVFSAKTASETRTFFVRLSNPVNAVLLDPEATATMPGR